MHFSFFIFLVPFFFFFNPVIVSYFRTHREFYLNRQAFLTIPAAQTHQHPQRILLDFSSPVVPIGLIVQGSRRFSSTQRSLSATSPISQSLLSIAYYLLVESSVKGRLPGSRYITGQKKFNDLFSNLGYILLPSKSAF